MRLKNLAKGTKDLFYLSPDQIEIEPGFNRRTRFDTPRDDELRESIKIHGIQQPLKGRKNDADKFVLTSGERRYRQVCQLLAEHQKQHGAQARIDPAEHPWALIPCLPDPAGWTQADRISWMLAENQGESLTMLEQAGGYRDLRGLGLTTDEIARRVGVSRPHVEACLLLVEHGCPEVLHAITVGRMSATLAVELIRFAQDDPARQLHLFEMAARNATQNGLNGSGGGITRKHFRGHLDKKAAPKKSGTARLSRPSSVEDDPTTDSPGGGQAAPPPARVAPAPAPPDPERATSDPAPAGGVPFATGTAAPRPERGQSGAGSVPTRSEPPTSGDSSGGGEEADEAPPGLGEVLGLGQQTRARAPRNVIEDLQSVTDDCRRARGDRLGTLIMVLDYLDGAESRANLVEWVISANK